MGEKQYLAISKSSNSNNKLHCKLNNKCNNKHLFSNKLKLKQDLFRLNNYKIRSENLEHKTNQMLYTKPHQILHVSR